MSLRRLKFHAWKSRLKIKLHLFWYDLSALPVVAWQLTCVYRRLRKKYPADQVEVIIKRWLALARYKVKKNLIEAKKRSARAKWHCIATVAKVTGLPQHVVREFIEKKLDMK